VFITVFQIILNLVLLLVELSVLLNYREFCTEPYLDVDVETLNKKVLQHIA
jgi:hypothetical protein